MFINNEQIFFPNDDAEKKKKKRLDVLCGRKSPTTWLEKLKRQMHEIF